jgi:ABC-type multidrug transport system fused ATPase/permease subunit
LIPFFLSTKMSNDEEKIIFKFTPVRLILVAKVLACLVWLVVFALLIGGLDAIGVSRREFVVQNKLFSFLLFPGTTVDSAVDIIYLIAIGMLVFVVVPFALISYFNMRKIMKKRVKKRVKKRDLDAFLFSFVVSLPIFQLYLHLCANLHWQFYGAIGVIPPENVFWIFDWRSSVCGFAGAIPVSLLVLFTMLGCYAIFYTLTGRLCFDRVVIVGTASPMCSNVGTCVC